MRRAHARLGLLPMAAALLLPACATTSTQPPAPVMPDFSAFEKMQAGECSPATAAMIGAALGALIADDNRGKGAAIGAGLGALACYIINTQSRQTEAGADVDRRYKADNQGALPAQPLVTQFDTAFNAGGGVRAGKEARVVSSIRVVNGDSEPVRDILEVLEVFESTVPDRVMLRAEKRVEEAILAGGIQNTFTIRLPAGLAPGSYAARTNLYVNGRHVGENRGSIRVIGTAAKN